MERGNSLSLGAQAIHCLLDRAPGAAPAHDKQLPLRTAVDLWWFQRLLKRRKLETAVANAFLVGLRTVGHATGAIVRQPGEGVHAPRPTWYKPLRQTGACIPIIGRRSLGNGALVDGRRHPGLLELRPRKRLLRRRQVRVAQDDHRQTISLGDLAGSDHRVETILDAASGHDDLRRVTVTAEAGRQQIALLELG